LAEDGSVRVWDLEQRRSVQIFRDAFHQLRGIAYTPDGNRVVFGAGDGTLCVLDMATHREVRRIEGQQAIFTAIALDADGRRVAGGGDDGSVGVWDLETGASMATLAGHAKSVGGVAFAPDGRFVVSGGGDRIVRVWDVESGSATQTFEGHSGSVRSVAVSLDGARIFSASGDRTVRCWRVEPSGLPQRTVAAETGAISLLAISSDGRRIVSGARTAFTPLSSQSAEVWDASSDRLAFVLEGHTKPIQALRMTADGTRALTASRDRTLRFWDLETGRTVHILKGHWDGVLTMAMTPTGNRAVSLAFDRTVRLWDLEIGRPLRVLVGPDAPGADSLRARALAMDDAAALHVDNVEEPVARSAQVAISPDGARAVVAQGHTLITWHLDTGRVVVAGLTDFDVEDASIDADAAIVGSLLGELCLVSPQDGRMLRTLDPGSGYAQSGRILDLLLDAAAGMATVATGDGSIRAWEIGTGREVFAFNSGIPKPDAVAIAPGGGVAYSVVGDTVAVSNLKTGLPVRRLSFDHNITTIAVTPNGWHAAVGDEAGRVHVVRLLGV
jgi:WD40 repeat protein